MSSIRDRGSASLYSLFVAMVILTVAIGFNWVVREHLKAGFSLSQKMEALVSAYSAYQLLLFTILPGKVLNKEIELYEGEKYLGIKRLPLNGTEVILGLSSNYTSTNATQNALNATILGAKTTIPLSISLQDTNGLISLTTLNTQVFDRLLKYAGVPEERRRVIIDSLLDWIDPDDLTRLNGAEKDYYEKEGKPYGPRNYQIQYPEELMLIRGMDEELYAKIEPYLTILPNSGFNPNTARREVVKAYLDIEDEKALDNLYAFLENGTILGNTQLFQLTGKALSLDEGVYFYPSLIFEIKIKAGYPRALYTLKFGLDARLKANTPYEILLWKEN